ncbi:MAG TPA: polyprenyl synthetase family protein [Longimicrobiaceae bacterium]|jgi:octaprenyl-diphosphate synthase|nr:polyprenyl synthetase family protein [Longimicrobiaceae bacterium]
MTLRTAPPKLADIQAPIHDRLDRVIDELRRIVVADFDGVTEINDYLLQVRGKLFRPSLLLLCNEVGGRPAPVADTLAALVELVHLATLVHDDAVDHSVMRRGMPTVNAMWSHQIAIIMGDYLYSRSLDELARLGELEPVRILAQASNAMSVGELRQLASCDALGFTERDYYQLIECKTASLMRAACDLGALSGAAEFREPLAKFGHELGMAFQIADDLLDYTADEAVTGKPSGLDLREHKVTLPLIEAMRHCSAAERQEIENFFADPEPTDEGIARIVEIVRARGGLDYARRQALAYARSAADALEGLPAGPALDALRDSIAYAIERPR